jgi:SAM-dependent methyltransferase
VAKRTRTPASKPASGRRGRGTVRGPEAYYDQLAPHYRLVYRDWEASVKRQASALDGVIREFIGPGARRVLDAACGIGTQSLGLAELGYQVTASDLSPEAVELARKEAARRKLRIDFGVVDMRRLSEVHRERFDVVLACDNAIPHLLTDDDILLALRQFQACTTPGGGCIISVRDYSQVGREGKAIHPRTVHETAGGRVAMFDVWEFDGDRYEMTTYVVHDRGGASAETQVIRGGRYYCVSLSRLEELLREAGFRLAGTFRDRFFQPLLVGLRPA